MKHSLLKFKTRAVLRKNNALRTSLPYQQSKSIGIIFTTEDKQKHEDIKDFIKKLEQDGKQVKVLSFLPKNTDNFEFLFDFFTEKDVNVWGTIKSEAALKFTEVPFDFLFYLDTTPNPLLLNLIARSKARCRSGVYFDQSEPFFELMIEKAGTIRTLIDNVYKYTSILR